MGLLASELVRVKTELGWNALLIGAEPFIGTSQLFEQVVQTYMSFGPSSTSTTVTQQQLGPTITQITLVSAAGFNVNDKVAVDVDARYEQARIESISGNMLTLQLFQAHGDIGGSSYFVSVEGGEFVVRENLREIANVKARISKAVVQAGLKQADEVQWYPGKSGMGGPLDGLYSLLNFWRDELAHTLGVPNLRMLDGSGAGSSGQSSTPVLY